MNDAPPGSAAPDRRPPRGALIVVVVGLVACVVAALASTGKGEGEAANLEWVQSIRGFNSKIIDLPGGGGTMQLTKNRLRVTGTNVSGYALFITTSKLTVSAGSPIGGSRILCTVKAPNGAEVAQSSGGLRGTYPRSSEAGIYNQEVPETVLMDFSSKSSELAVLEFPDRPARFTTERGVKVAWPRYKPGEERIEYSIAGKPKHDLELPFFTIWRSQGLPLAQFSCTIKTSAGEATAGADAYLTEHTPPIDEEAEEIKAEEQEEAEEEEEAEKGDAG